MHKWPNLCNSDIKHDQQCFKEYSLYETPAEEHFMKKKPVILLY